MEFGGPFSDMLDKMDNTWNNKMSSLTRKTEPVGGKADLFDEALAKQKQAHKQKFAEQFVSNEAPSEYKNAFEQKKVLRNWQISTKTSEASL
ncbi:hypothetical protein CAEBREN_09213 [Caenorhabditis brenneri]|uniref:Uncharacterized protein n=1 Tax=Caenorhabditis brenneri TaxID=135651 RepID=G0ND58_CAEBE|nr:hypothetical protein CAEBREN_09213 [Caenorhabditis brenneri]